MKRFYIEIPISQSLIDEPEFDIQTYLSRQFIQSAYAYETDPCADEEAHPLEAYRCVNITGPMNRGERIVNPPAQSRVYGGHVEREI